MSEAATEGAATEPSTASESQPTPQDIERLNAAIAKERDLRKEAEKAAKEGRTAAERLAEIEQANASETEKAVAAARKEGETAALERANTRLVRAEARALAAELGFIDPADALGQIDLSEVSVNDEGDVDSEAVRKELADLAERKKYLLKSARDTSGSDAGIGAAGDKPKPGTKAADLAQIEADLAAAGRRR